MAEQINRDREYSRETYYPGGFKRISWGAVFAGTIVAIMVSLVLGLLGIGIGAATINPMSEQQPAQGLGMGAAIWWAITTLIAFFVGGYVAGRLAGVARRIDAMLHGIVTWGLATLFTLFLLGSAIGQLIGGTTSLLQGLAQSPATTRIQEPAGSQNWKESAKARLKEQLQKDGKTAAEADRAVEEWSQSLQRGEIPEGAGAEVEQAAREAGSTVASGASKAAWGAFTVMILGALAGAFGGRIGISRDLREEPVARAA